MLTLGAVNVGTCALHVQQRCGNPGLLSFQIDLHQPVNVLHPRTFCSRWATIAYFKCFKMAFPRGQLHSPFQASTAGKRAGHACSTARHPSPETTVAAARRQIITAPPDQLQWLGKAANATCISAAAALILLDASAGTAEAARGRLPPITESANRCDVSALDKFADTRAKFSQEASGGNMVEAIVDIRDCDFSNTDLSGKVFSGVMMQGANLSNSQVVGSQFARADASGATLKNVDFTDANCYSTRFDGADVTGAQFENSILTAATFGKDRSGTWANLKGAHFEGALLSSSDVGRICENPTLEDSTKKFELGCRATK